MDTLTTAELAVKLAGGDSYIRTKNGEVMGLAVTTSLNPDAPEIIVVGTGPRIILNAELFFRSQQHVPVYVKQSVNEWKYMGHYKAESYDRSPLIIDRYRRHRSVDDVSGILFLSARDTEEIEVRNSTFLDPETKKRVENAAIDAVGTYYKSKGYTVTDRQKDNLGYDLLVEKQREVLKVEVKGTALKQQRFFLSRNERAKSADPQWRLAVVTGALTSPKLEVFDTVSMERQFQFDPLCWECSTVN